MSNYSNLSDKCLIEKKNRYLSEIAEYESAILSSNSQIYLLYLASMVGKKKSKIRSIDAELALRKLEADK